MSLLFLILSVLLRAIGLPMALPRALRRGTSVLDLGLSSKLAAMLIFSNQSKDGQITIQSDLVSGWPPTLTSHGDRPGNDWLLLATERSLI